MLFGDLVGSISCFDGFSPSLRFLVMSGKNYSFFDEVVDFMWVKVGFLSAMNMTLQ